MALISPRRGRPPLPKNERVVRETPVALRLPPAEHERTHAHARREGRTVANFARRIYLIGFAQYEAELAQFPSAA